MKKYTRDEIEKLDLDSFMLIFNQFISNNNIDIDYTYVKFRDQNWIGRNCISIIKFGDNIGKIYINTSYTSELQRYTVRDFIDIINDFKSFKDIEFLYLKFRDAYGLESPIGGIRYINDITEGCTLCLI